MAPTRDRPARGDKGDLNKTRERCKQGEVEERRKRLFYVFVKVKWL